MTLLIIPTNSLLTGDGIVHCATRWLTVATALRRPNRSAVRALCVECHKERVRWHGSSLDGWGLVDAHHVERLGVHDVEATASVHQYFGESLWADDRVDHKRISSWVWDDI